MINVTFKVEKLGEHFDKGIACVSLGRQTFNEALSQFFNICMDSLDVTGSIGYESGDGDLYAYHTLVFDDVAITLEYTFDTEEDKKDFFEYVFQILNAFILIP